MKSINKIYEINYSDSVYPESLKNIASSPKKIYAMGNISLLNMNSIAVVGSRNNSDYGEKMAKNITKQLVQNNMIIVSGMAVGIDAIAHQTCIKNNGKTIAVLGSGLKQIYPKENEKLFFDIIESGGLVVSEFPSDYPVQMKNFPKRNRIISGLALGVLVVEASYRSGTSITARLAKNQNKKVFCIPNSIGNKNSYGTIELIKKGAILVRNAEDILKELNLHYAINKKNNAQLVNVKSEKQLQILDVNCKKIIECIAQSKGMKTDKICAKTNLDAATVNQLLTKLELDEIIIDTGNGYDLMEVYYG